MTPIKMNEKPTTDELISSIIDWSIDRITSGLKSCSISKNDALSIRAEFSEWIEAEDEEVELLMLETEYQ